MHVLFEEDLLDSAVGGQELSNRKSGIRRVISESLYERSYRSFGGDEDSSAIPGTAHGFGDDNDELDEELTELAARQVRSPMTRPYVPPTPMEADAPLPFGNVLDAPVD